MEQGWEGAVIAKLFQAFVDDAGKEAPLRRERLRWACGFAADLYRQTLHVLISGPPSDDAELQQSAERVARAVPNDEEVLAAVIERLLAAIEQVDRNAHPNMLIDAACDDVDRLLAPAAT
jgi:hypothetical protein